MQSAGGFKSIWLGTPISTPDASETVSVGHLETGWMRSTYGGIRMSDVFESFDAESSAAGATLRRPPLAVVGVAGGLVIAAIVMFAVSSQVGYGLSVLAMLANSFASFQDQKARADFNYAQLDWYRPTATFLRFLTLIVAAGHVLVLAIESAR